MATPWDRAAAGYLEEWVPRFVPYHLNLVGELALRAGQRVLVTSAGPGSEVLACARAVGDGGYVRATDSSDEMVKLLREQVERARFATRIEAEVADAADVTGGPWDAIVCAFGLWQLDAAETTVAAWAKGLAPGGKVGVLTWGPYEKDQPFEMLRASLDALEPSHGMPRTSVDASRDAMAAMFDAAGLVLVRHTVVHHTMSFLNAEAFVRAMREACTWRRVHEELGDARMDRVAAHFLDKVGGLSTPLSFAPAATIAIAAQPGSEVELLHRTSVRVPPTS